MINTTIVFLLALFLATLAKPNLNIGTGGFGYGCGSNSPLAQLPFGMVRLGPDTTPPIKKAYTRFQHYGGYSDDDRYLRAFSHMHLVGAGVLDLGILGVIPLKQNKPSIPKDRFIWFKKSSQYSQPGYYRVQVESNITVELTSTLRAGVHRYSFEGQRNLYIMASYFLIKGSQMSSEIRFLNEKSLEGKIVSHGSFSSRFGGLNTYFYVQWKDDVKAKGVWDDKSLRQSTSDVKGNNTGVYLTIGSGFTLYVGISYVSAANARQNLYQETNLNSFDEVLGSARAAWKKELDRFQITAISKQDQQKIDTAIYRTLSSPTTFSDWNGEYMSFGDLTKVEKKPDWMKAVYTDMSLWDVHRTQMPWILFHDVQRFNDIAWSILLINEQGGYMPKWPFANGPTGCMIGAHANTVLSDWIIKEAKKLLTPQQLNTIYEYMLRNANTETPHDSRTNPKTYLQYGYNPYDQRGKGATAQTLEFSYNDYCIAQVAKLVNKSDDYDQFMRRSKFYKNVWNNQTQFFEPRNSSGKFIGLSTLQRLDIFSNYYVEGNAWHYRFYAPHDPEGLIELFGGPIPFAKQLQILFKRSQAWPNFVLPNPYYWAGNEHDLYSVWLFPAANRSDLTQKYSRMIINTFYGNEGNGIPGNDDYATMSAWLVFAQLGFYPLPGTQKYILGSPMIHCATIQRRLADGSLKPFNINVQRNSVSKYLVKSATINGQPIKELMHNQMERPNSFLEFVMA